MTDTRDVLIAGGGIVGLTVAIAMQQRGYSVALLDSGSLTVETDISRVYAVNEASRQLFQQIGVFELMDKSRLSPYRHMQVWDAKSGASIHFHARLMASRQLGFILEESLIRKALLEKISTLDNILLLPHSPVENIHEQMGCIQAGSGDKQWRGKLLLVTDGAQSPTRQLLKVPLTSWSYHQAALVATVHTALPHQQTAFQVFHPDGPLALLPLADDTQCSIVWSTSPEKAVALRNLPEAAFNEAIMQAFGESLGEITVISPRYHFPLTMRHAQQYAGDHWILLGDAAHTIHPLAGLGLNVGLADVRDWLSCLPTHQTLPPSAKIMGMYQRKRKYDTWQVIALMEGLKRLFSTTSQPAIFLRGLGLRACDTLTPLKRFLVSQAMGVHHD